MNRVRKSREFARTYHSAERVEFVKEFACAACGRVGYTQNAHVLGVDGMGRKGHYTTIAPLCGNQFVRNRSGSFWGCGCHTLFDQSRAEFRQRFPEFDAETVAANTERAWLAFLGTTETDA